jgi:hypothetical protein
MTFCNPIGWGEPLTLDKILETVKKFQPMIDAPKEIWVVGVGAYRAAMEKAKAVPLPDDRKWIATERDGFGFVDEGPLGGRNPFGPPMVEEVEAQLETRQSVSIPLVNGTLVVTKSVDSMAVYKMPELPRVLPPPILDDKDWDDISYRFYGYRYH